MASSKLRLKWLQFQTRSVSTVSTASSLKIVLQRGAPIDIHPEVQDALANKKPVVALETTLITHGLPQPQNYQVGCSLENIVRSTGSVPATIGMIGGRIKIGLEENELQRLADKTYKPVKVSRRDVAPAVATKADGGTTCSATLLFAALADIKIFSTGGLGGVHRGGENSMDISADLGELARSPVGLVSAGVKSILDIGRTLEYLETLGVPVIAYSETPEFPAFFSRHSGFNVPWNVSDPLTAAKILHAQWQLGMDNGALIAVPIPEDYEAIGATIQDAVIQAVAESERNGMSKRGKEVTPWLLQRVSELTNNTSLESNIALLENNARIGGQIAVHYHQLQQMDDDVPTSFMPIQSQRYSIRDKNKFSRWPPPKLVVIGSSAVDITSKPAIDSSSVFKCHSTTPGSVSLTLGGVARNITEAAHRVMASAPQIMEPPMLISPIGDDSFGRLMKSEMQVLGMRVDGLLECGKSQRTAVCNMILDNNGELIGGIADMDVAELFAPGQILPVISKAKPNIVALDANLSPATLAALVAHCKSEGINVFFEPTSVVKSSRILPAILPCLSDRPGSAPVAFTSPNLLELSHMYHAARLEHDLMSHSSWWSIVDSFSLGSGYRTDLEQLAKRMACDEDQSKGTLAFLLDEGVAQMAVQLLPFFQHFVIKCGGRGILLVMHIQGPSTWLDEASNIFKRYVIAHGKSGSAIVLQHFPIQSYSAVTNVTGAGDTFVGALLAHLVQQPGLFSQHNILQTAIRSSQQAAKLTLQSNLAVSPDISYQVLQGS